MSITATFYTTNKRYNSTQIPTGGTTLNIVIKDPSSVLNPTILIERSNPTAFNYVHISSFGRYYYINDWISDHGMWIANCTCDVLASWKNSLLSSVQYVTRSGSQSDSYIIDGKYATTTDMDISNIDVTGGGFKRPFMRNVENYKYIISTSNGADSSSGNPQKLGGASYYCLSPGEAQMLMGYLLSEPTYMTLNVDEISDSLAKGLINPIQYVSESYIIPYKPQENLVPASLWCGWWPVDASNTYPCLPSYSDLHKWTIWESDPISVPSHPQTSQVGVFVNSSGYTSITLFAGIFGAIPIDPMLASKYPSWKVKVYGDFKGKAELDVFFYDNVNTTWVLWDRFYANVAVPVGLSQLTSDAISAVAGAAQGITGVGTSLLKGDYVKAIGSGVSAISSLAGVSNPHIAGQAQAAAVAYLLDDWFVQTEHHLITDTAPGIVGAPLCKEVLLSELTGYCQIDDPYLQISATASELEEITNLMKAGFYIL